MKKPRCSIYYCFWRAKYGFGIKGLYECWFHGGDIEWLVDLWEILTKPARFLYNWIRYGWYE